MTIPIVVKPSERFEFQVFGVDGKPLAGAKLQARRVPFQIVEPSTIPQPESELLRRALCMVEGHEFVSDDRGRFSWTTPVNSGFVVRGEARGFASWETLCWPSKIYSNFFSFSPEATVTGTVVDMSSGRPVSSAAVRLMNPDGANIPFTSAVMTTEDGVFVLHGPCGALLTPRALVRVEAPKYAVANKRIQPFSPGTKSLVVIQLSPASTLAGSVVDTDGKPVSRVQLDVRVKGADGFDRTYSDDKGQFRFTSVPESGTLQVSIACAGYCGRTLFVESRGEIPTPIALERSGVVKIEFHGKELSLLGEAEVFLGVRREDLDAAVIHSWEYHRPKFEAELTIPVREPGNHTLFVHVSGRALAIVRRLDVASGRAAVAHVSLDEGCRLRGRVVYSRSKAVAAGVQVAILAPRAANGQLGGPSGLATTTSSDGLFELTGVPSGSQDIDICESDGSCVTHTKEVPRGGVLDVGDMSLTQLSRIEGRVEWSVAPVSLPSAVLLDNTGNVIGIQSVPTTGLFAFERVMQGEYVVRLQHADSTTAFLGEERVQLHDGDDARVSFLYGGASLRGRVQNFIREPQVTWNIQAFDVLTDARKATQTLKDDGSFELLGLTPGAYVLHLRSSATGVQDSLTHEVDLESGENRWDPALSGSELKCFVTDAEGAPLEAVSILYRASGRSRFARRTGVTNSRGEMTLRNLMPGTYRVNFQKDAFELKRIDSVSITANARSELKITLVKEARIVARILDSVGMPLAGAEARACPVAYSDVNPPFTGADRGVVSFGRLSAGEYDVSVRAHGCFPSLTRVNVPPAATVEHAPKLVPSGRVKITVRSASGASLAVAPVLVGAAGVDRNSDDWIRQGFIQTSTGTNLTNEKGEITLEGVPAVLLTITVPGGAPATVTAAKGELREVVVTVP